ncbi:hypothetical protein [Helicobacter bizzozeronii]|uniref:hypothetical protein n=1 Tax=Helicobacter bizzozeronii TaxID=56877 RepID=UPI000CF0DA27|nr:hypothetical protein [Helicobacter bizzozeronii]
MDNFLNGFLKAWRAWRDDGKEAFMRAFLKEVQQSQISDSEHFLTLLKQEMQAVGATRSTTDQQDILAISDYIDTFKKEVEHTMQQAPAKQGLELEQTQEYGGAKQAPQLQEDLEHQELQQDTTTLEAVTQQPNKLEQELVIANEALDAHHTLIQKVQEQQKTLQAMAQELTELKQQQQTQDKTPSEPQTETQEQELGQAQDDLEQHTPTQDTAIAQSKLEVAEELEQAPQAQEGSEEQELLQSITIFQDEIQEVLAEHSNRAEQVQEPETKDLVEQKQEGNLEQLSQSEQGLEVSNENYSELQQTPLQATEIDNKYAKLHSYFKQVELDVQQKRIKTKTDFKESFLNYAKSHMTEAELKVLLVLSQKQPSKLTQEHLNLINDALEQAHGNKHMQDLGLQLSVKAVLGHPLEAEQYTAIQNYVQQCQASLEPMDGKVADAMNSHLAKMQKSRETTTESQANQQEATQIRETIAEPSQNATQPITAPPPEPWIQSQNSHKPWLETQTQDTQTAQQGVPNNKPTPPLEPWLDAPAKPRGRRR